MKEPDAHSIRLFRQSMVCVFDETIMKGWSINKLANEADLSHETVRRAIAHETRYVRFQTVVKLCRVINLDILNEVRNIKKTNKNRKKK